MNQVNNPIEISHNDNDQLLTERDIKLDNQDRLPGFTQEYHCKIVNKLNFKQTKFMLIFMTLEFYLSIGLVLYLYLTDNDNFYEVYTFFPYVLMTVLLVEIILKISINFNIRREAILFYTNINTVKNKNNKKNKNDSKMNFCCSFSFSWLHGLFQLEILYINNLLQSLVEFTLNEVEYENEQNQMREQESLHQSIQQMYSYIKFRQLYIMMKLSIFLLLLNNYPEYCIQALVLCLYIAYLTVLNTWVNYHFAVVYLFCRASILSKSDFLSLIAEISIKCLHSAMFLYLITHISGVKIIVSSIFISVCSILAAATTVQMNNEFDDQQQGVFDMLFLGFSVNYYVGLKHREYFVKKVGYQYKIDLLKQIVILCIQIAIIIDYYETNIAGLRLQQEIIIGLSSVLSLFRVCMTIFKISYYLKPKQVLIRLKTFSGIPHFIEETLKSPQSLNFIPNNNTILIKQQQQFGSASSLNCCSIIIKDVEQELIQQNKEKALRLQREKMIKDKIISKLELSPYKLTFYSEQGIYELVQSRELKFMLSELIKYKKTEFIFLISNQIKILNQYGHINVLIHRYNKELIEFIESYLMPEAQSIQIDSCYQNNSDVFIQLMLLYNTIDKEFNLNTKMILQPQDMLNKLPITQNQKTKYQKVIKNLTNSKIITMLKIIAMNNYISPSLLINPCYVLFDLANID
ncbi:transmembrane protein, putative (macronuclear) [Tetrahymena thermophila SB210]|uniref:Transmembrane protein, putative n=1 Tax=Tetrahymena thermophila (strain SB210) TaxID=312017 RepID=Q23FD0_TETTS|nr:transmembrane protein, putative [Tetrahymena thermophila SB210]EAR95223.2 transmembrane protein, putative [Tetrahymena thermophila SB210]|eukprot:XP_001015468.2 transmembrane protein, putative [Tetrahymena thermophila SB210]